MHGSARPIATELYGEDRQTWRGDLPPGKIASVAKSTKSALDARRRRGGSFGYDVLNRFKCIALIISDHQNGGKFKGVTESISDGSGAEIIDMLTQLQAAANDLVAMQTSKFARTGKSPNLEIEGEAIIHQFPKDCTVGRLTVSDVNNPSLTRAHQGETRRRNWRRCTSGGTVEETTRMANANIFIRGDTCLKSSQGCAERAGTNQPREAYRDWPSKLYGRLAELPGR